MNESRHKMYIKLVHPGEREQDVALVLSKIQGLTSAPEHLIANAPCYISGRVSRSVAEKVKAYLEHAGAVVELDGDTSLPLKETEGLPPMDSGGTALPLAERPGYALPSIQTSADYFPSQDDDPLAREISATEASEILEAEIERRPSRNRARRKRRHGLLWGTLLLLIMAAGGGVWIYRSGQLSTLSKQYEENPVVGQVGILTVKNPEEATLRLFHVLGTRVEQEIPFEGENTRLRQGDYYVEARQGLQTLYFPVYIEGRGHQVTVTIDFPAAMPAPSDRVAYIPAGWFRMGNKETSTAHFGFPDEKPDIDVYVGGFFLSKYEVTNREFARFVEEGGYQQEVYWDRLIADWKSLTEQVPAYGSVYGNNGWPSVKNYISRRFVDTDDRPGPRLWENDTPPYDFAQDDHPVIGITLYEADAYCKWMTQQTGKLHRLPTEAEWEKAARGYSGYAFSYGNEYDPSRGNTESEGPRRVGTYPPNSYGIYDLTGNVWEWVADHYNARAYEALLKKYRTEIRNPRFFDESKRYDRVIVRGGSFRSVNRINARTSVRYPMFPNDWHSNIGFRYVIVP